MREGAAPIDVRDQVAGGACVSRDGEVHYISRHQIRFSRAARALQHDPLEVPEQGVERTRDGRPEPIPTLEPRHRAQSRIVAAQDHDLAARVRFGLEQDRIHPGLRRHAGGEGLKVLGAANLRSVRAHARVVRHVLRLERRHSLPPPREPAAQRRGEERFPGIATAAEHHDRAFRDRRHLRRSGRPAIRSQASSAASAVR